jgi:hypothetical protein
MGGHHDGASAAHSARALTDFIKRVREHGLPDRSAQLEAAALEALAAFLARGVRSLLLKGPALARVLYTADEGRRYSDVDLLVADEDQAEARRILADLGYRNAEERTGIDDVAGIMYSETWVRPAVDDESWLHIDLHWRLAGSEAPPGVTWNALAARHTWIDLAGGRAPVPSLGGLAMHVALHAAQHARDKPMTDLALGLERWPPETWQEAADLARELEATEAFAAGLRLLPAGTTMARELDLPATDELSWAILHSDTRPRGTFHLQAFADAQSLGERLDVLRRSLLPRREWIVSQYPWARNTGALLLIAAYGVHLVRAPAWAGRAWRFARQARRAR